MEKPLDTLLDRTRKDPEILAVILFGSRAREEQTPTSDIDLCLVLFPRRYDPLHLSRKKLEYLKVADIDIQVFQQLPLYIRRRVLKEGKVLFTQNEDLLYEVAFRTAQAFEDFKHRYYEYLEQVADAGS